MEKGKSILVFTAAMMFAVICNATVRTVDNNPGAPNDGVHNFNTMGAALGASSNGDTIYVQGSNSTYGDLWLYSKSLVIIGTGHNPASWIGKANTTVSGFTNVHIGTGCSNSKIIGLSINIIFQDESIDNITISRCKITDKLDGGNWCGCRFPSCNNWIIEGCVFTNTVDDLGWGNSSMNSPSHSSGVIIRNNIFAGEIYFSGGCSGFQVFNNIFLKTSNAVYIWNGGAVLQLFNNIFYSHIPDNGGTISAYNNAVYDPAGGTYTGTNNVVYSTTTPFFVSAAPGTFSYSNDYHIVSGSPLLVGGVSSTEVGAYGGTSAGIFSMTGFPPLPNVIQFTTSPTNPVIPVDGVLQINVTSQRIH